MLARAVLEEKNDLLDREDGELRSLHVEERRLSAELAGLRAEAARLSGRLDRARRTALNRGIFDAVAAVTRIGSRVERPPGADAPDASGRLLDDLLDLLKVRHGLQIIGSPVAEVDPVLHRVIEKRAAARAGVEVLQRGYRMGGRVVSPALVRVLEAGAPAQPRGATEG